MEKSLREARQGAGMKRHGKQTNDFLARVAGRFCEHAKAAREGSPAVQEMARMACSVDLWEMWAMTQK